MQVVIIHFGFTSFIMLEEESEIMAVKSCRLNLMVLIVTPIFKGYRPLYSPQPEFNIIVHRG